MSAFIPEALGETNAAEYITRSRLLMRRSREERFSPDRKYHASLLNILSDNDENDTILGRLNIILRFVGLAATEEWKVHP